MSDRANELLAESRRNSTDALCRKTADVGGWCCSYHDGFGDAADIMCARLEPERDAAMAAQKRAEADADRLAKDLDDLVGAIQSILHQQPSPARFAHGAAVAERGEP